MEFKINETLLVSIVAFVALIVFVVWQDRATNSFRCPNDYRTADEYINGMFEWISEELKKAPQMTREELLEERARLFLQYNCEKSRWTEEIFGEPEEDIQTVPVYPV